MYRRATQDPPRGASIEGVEVTTAILNERPYDGHEGTPSGHEDLAVCVVDTLLASEPDGTWKIHA